MKKERSVGENGASGVVSRVERRAGRENEWEMGEEEKNGDREEVVVQHLEVSAGLSHYERDMLSTC